MIAELPLLSAPPPVPPPRRDDLHTTVSASRLQCWQQCRLKFYFRYVLQLAKPLTVALHVGTVVHAVLRAWNLGRWRRQPFVTEAFKKIFNEGWQTPERPVAWDGEDAAALQDHTWRVLEHYFLTTPIQAPERPEAVEVPVEADLSEHGLPRLVGVLDLVRAGGRIVDFKTASRTPSAAEAQHQHGTQMTCYSVLYRNATGRPEAGLELHHLVKTKAPKLVITSLPPLSPGQQSRLFRQIESYQRGLAQEDFIPAPGLLCGGCEYFAECRQWQNGEDPGGSA